MSAPGNDIVLFILTLVEKIYLLKCNQFDYDIILQDCAKFVFFIFCEDQMYLKLLDYLFLRIPIPLSFFTELQNFPEVDPFFSEIVVCIFENFRILNTLNYQNTFL